MKDNNHYILGADIGGSHITLSVVDTRKRVLLSHSYVREKLDASGSILQIIDCWAEAIKKSIALTGEKVNKIGLALPGPFDYEKGISFIKDQGKYDNLYQTNVKEKLAEALNLPIENFLFDNDASCFLKGEIFVGKAPKNINILGLTLGTGLGSVVSLDGEVSDAELWCSEFKDGQAEDYFSTRWFLKRYKELTGESIASVKLICEQADAVIVKQIFEEFGTNLCLLLKNKIKVFNPQTIIIGGNIAKASTHFMPYLKALEVPVKITTLGEASALLGAVSNFLK